MSVPPPNALSARLARFVTKHAVVVLIVSLALTGASVASGKTLTVTLDLADDYIDSGFQLRVDSAVEDMRDKRNDIVVPLTIEGAGKSAVGRGYVKAFTYSF